ncbi:hypothetical protein NDU88_001695 [Pleurodeles waltl]|uniref:Uncharacterized protein n=1 Tax=Pleurodeles waltl TaxID=8319 RepID=A0AAV7LBR4_PLEWA|nr:hypothetical protein NDU88_001695 [Pleurodeles waltl]
MKCSSLLAPDAAVVQVRNLQPAFVQGWATVKRRGACTLEEGCGHRLKLLAWVRVAGRIQNPDNTPTLCTASVFQGVRGRARDRGLSSSGNPCRQLWTRVGSHINDRPGGWVAGAPADTAAPALDSACGQPCGRIHVHNCSREACIDENCRASARFNLCTRGRPGGWAAVVSFRLVWTGAAPYLGPCVGGHIDDRPGAWAAGTPATGAIGGSTSTDPRVCAPAAAPALDAACGLPDGRIYIHNRSREACVDVNCRTSARFNKCTRGWPGGRAAVTLLRLVGTGAAPHCRPRFGAAVLDEAAPLPKQYSTDRGLLPHPTAHSSYHPLDKFQH